MLRRVLVLAFALASISCSNEADPHVDWTEFDATVQSFLDAHGLEGATAVVVHRDYGVMHTRAFGSFGVDRISLLASSSKVLSVGVIMRLADQGLLDLDAPISTYLADYGQYKTDITLAQMLSNSSGMVGLLDDPMYGNYICQYLGGVSLAQCGFDIYTAPDQADRVPPDTAFRYGGGQWQLAGAIAEVVSGKSWADLVAETYRPCRTPSIGYTNLYAQAAAAGNPFAYPSIFDGDPASLPPTENPSIEGGAYSNVSDYAQILLLHLRAGQCAHGRVLSEAAVARMEEDRIGEVYGGTTIDPTLPGYGLGWWVSRAEPGVVADAGAYGATPWLDTNRGYGVMIILEANATLGSQLRLELTPVVEAIFDGLATK